jgi:hypothetical protein
LATVARLERDSKRAEIIRMRFAGQTLQQVGDQLGLTLQGVKYHEDAWLAEQKPSSEVTEERRQKQLAGIDAVRARLFEHLEGDDGKPDVAIVDRLAKLWEREAKLVGLDLQQGINVTVVTREALAAALWSADDVVDVEATEETEA